MIAVVRVNVQSKTHQKNTSSETTVCGKRYSIAQVKYFDTQNILTKEINKIAH